MTGMLTFGEWLDDQLRQKDMRHGRFAEAIGVAPSTVSSWVNNVQRPRWRVCREIARALRVDVNEVLLRAGHEPEDRDYVLPEDRRGEREEYPLSDDEARRRFAELMEDPLIELYTAYKHELSIDDMREIGEFVVFKISRKARLRQEEAHE